MTPVLFVAIVLFGTGCTQRNYYASPTPPPPGPSLLLDEAERNLRELLETLRDPDDNVRLEAMYALKDRLAPDTRREALVNAIMHRDYRMPRRRPGPPRGQ